MLKTPPSWRGFLLSRRPAFGRFLPFDSVDFKRLERPLLEKADIH